MPQAWRTVRIFISSTFRDMHAERDYLVRVVFPAIRERLLPHRLYLDDIDLRWGVTQAQADRDMALDLCLAQIDQSRPFFLGLLGERYGYVPDRFTDDAVSKYGWVQHHTGKSITELEVVYGVLGQPEMRPRALFFFRDRNWLTQVPPGLRGQFEEPPEATARDNASGRTKLALLKQAIRDASLPIEPIEDYPCRFGGVKLNWRLARLELAADDVAALEDVAHDGLVSAAEFTRLDERRQSLVSQLGALHLEDLEEFGRAVEWRLWSAICDEYAISDAPAKADGAPADLLSQELDSHLRFRDGRLRVYVGRDQIERDLEAYAEGDETTPCLVRAPSGLGKSAALARFARDYPERRPDVLLVLHFIGATPASTSLRRMLQRFCEVLQLEFGNSEDDGATVEGPATIADWIARFASLVAQVPNGRRVVFIIDALNQLDDAENSPVLRWLPANWPGHVKAVVSCISDPGRPEPVLDAFAARPHRRLDLPQLADEERRLIIREVPSLSAKTLDELQVEMLLENPATANPLFLIVALEELRGFGSFEQLDRRIGAFPRAIESAGGDNRPRQASHEMRAESDPRVGARWSRWAAAVAQAPRVENTVTALFDQVIDRLHDDFGAEPADSVLSLLASARRGLSEQELVELTAASGTGANPRLFPVLRQLRPYLQHRGALLDFFHRHLLLAVRARLLPTAAAQAAAHQRLADYFTAQEYFLENLQAQQARARRLPPTPRPVNIRKVDELPWQLMRIGELSSATAGNSPEWDALADLLLDWRFLEAKAEAQG